MLDTLDTIANRVILNGERVAYAGSVASQVGEVGVVFDAIMQPTRGWVYHVALDNGQNLCFASRASLVPLREW